MKLCSDLLAEREANISLRKENAQLEGKAAFYDPVSYTQLDVYKRQVLPRRGL